MLCDSPHERITLPALLIGDFARAGVVRVWQTLQYALLDCTEEKLPLLQAPTLVVRGADDRIVPQRWAE